LGKKKNKQEIPSIDNRKEKEYKKERGKGGKKIRGQVARVGHKTLSRKISLKGGV